MQENQLCVRLGGDQKSSWKLTGGSRMVWTDQQGRGGGEGGRQQQHGS